MVAVRSFGAGLRRAPPPAEWSAPGPPRPTPTATRQGAGSRRQGAASARNKVEIEKAGATLQQRRENPAASLAARPSRKDGSALQQPRVVRGEPAPGALVNASRPVDGSS